MINQKLFVDTHILIKSLMGDEMVSEEDPYLSSVAASEFLNAQTHLTRANYYVPILGQRHIGNYPLTGAHRRNHAFPKHVTDSVFMDFLGQHPTIIHYNNIALADVINTKNARLFDDSIIHLSKERKKSLRRKFNFLLKVNAKCIPISKDAVETALYLLSALENKYSVKQNFRNSWNDLLIAATAITSLGKLETKDSFLAREVAKYVHAKTETKSEELLQITFQSTESELNNFKRESKGYINRSWRIRFSQNSHPTR